MEMCFHGNQLSWGINHPLISLWSKYPSPALIRLSTMLAPVISSLDKIYCTSEEVREIEGIEDDADKDDNDADIAPLDDSEEA